MNSATSIAIIDDHVLFRKSLAILIDMFALYRVTCQASNGEEFIKEIKAGNLPDIVLMDINMPVMDGYATTSWISEHHPQIKVIALTTMDAEAAIIKMIKCGAKGYVMKDAEPEELKNAFEEVINRGYFYNEYISHQILKSVSMLLSDNETNLFAKLSARELDFLKYNCSEFSYKEIAEKMCVSVRTVEGYRDILCEKLRLKTRTGLVIYAIKNKLVNI